MTPRTAVWLRVVVTTAALAAATSAGAQERAAGPARPTPPIALDDRPDRSALAALERAGALPFPVAVRLDAAGTGTGDFDVRAGLLVARGTRLWLVIDAPAAQADIEPWRARLQALLGRYRDHLAVLEVRVTTQPAPVARFAVQAAAIEASAHGQGVRVAIGGSAMADATTRRTIYTDALAPYVDLLALPSDRLTGADAWLQSRDAQADLAVVPAATNAAEEDLVESTLAQAGSRTAIRAWRATDAATVGLRALTSVPWLLTHRIVTIEDTEVSLAVIGGPAAPHRLLFDTDTFATYFAYWGDRATQPMSVDLAVRVDGTPRLFDLGTGTVTRLDDAVVDAAAGRARVRLPVTGRAMLVAFNDETRPFTERSEASAERQLSVGEIIARHQRQQRTQDALVDNYVARVTMEQHFRPTMADPGYDVVAENTYFAGRDGVEWAETSFAVNGSKWGADRPPFPLLQPEKVLSLPLLLRFDEGYTYRLGGRERVADYDCYVVKFEPVHDDPSLYRGTVWIDRQTFARVRVQAVRSRLAAPVISNDETQEYRAVATLDGHPIFLFTRLDARQIVLVAGRNLLVEKRVVFRDFRVNDPQFTVSRATARESEAVMFRETPAGLRYYVKENGQRVVEEEPTRDVTALAMGVTLDPSYSFPLPIFGINYLNFRFRNPDTQLAILFAGVLAAGNIQRSKIGGTALDASVDFFAIAAPASDRVYGLAGEDPAVRVLTWPLSTGLNLGWQATPFLKATLQYQFRFDGYVGDRTTAEEFVVPSSTVTNGIGGAWEYRRGGYSFVSNAAWYRRASWTPWGTGDVSSPTYAKYTASLSRDFYLDAFRKLHFNGSWFGSQDVDRFSTYQFGMFDDTRIHGVPSSGVRYAELAMARGAYSINIFEQYRVDLFLEHAWGRTVAGRGRWDTIPAIGIALNMRAPWDTILRVDAGKSWLPDRFDRLGSATLQVMLLKPLK